MYKRLHVTIQSLIPQHLLSNLMGWMAKTRIVWLKNFYIRLFMYLYTVDLSEAIIENANDYPDFNAFFTRKLKPELRPLLISPSQIASPVDGTISQIGQINKNQLVQAKNFYFNLEALLNDQELEHAFTDGSFATLYLAPHNYHRVHMPITGILKKTIYIPGKLFSVNQMTSQLIPQLFSRNERLICYFTTAHGPMAVILVGAMIVGSIQTVWMDKPIRSNQIIRSNPPNIELKAGMELGFFELGSTVILLFGKDKIIWNHNLKPDSEIKMGQILGNILTP